MAAIKINYKATVTFKGGSLIADVVTDGPLGIQIKDVEFKVQSVDHPSIPTTIVLGNPVGAGSKDFGVLGQKL